MPRLALIQHGAGEIKAGNVAHAAELVRRAAGAGADIVCLPEVFHSRFRMTELGREFFTDAEPVPGPTTERMARLARELGVVLVVPVFEHAGRGVYYNSAAVLDADGTLLGKYRKQHIPLNTIFYEKLYFKPGNLGYPVFGTRAGRIGVYICHDRHYPEGARALALGGAELILIPVATPASSLSSAVFELEIRAHAVFNELFVAAVNRVGVEGEHTYYGRSLVAAPDGRVLAQAGDGEEILLSDVDFAEIDERRLAWQFFRDRRPHTYAALIEEQP
ncbi:nitrilase-related carbon-nitrogen hydrolase [Actinophytocola sp.]|uniref:nitrilase-related carbon-nitrogen hydrolase n=1 Tax=Actinophytocola sp. TaxID=1872138 RepID=UPI003D6B2AB6